MTTGRLVVPSFADAVAGRAPAAGVSGDDWLTALPNLIEKHLSDWDLTPDGEPWHGQNALVIPVHRGVEPLALKLTWPHSEARAEHLVLRAWNGRGAVRLAAADPAAYVLLLERLDGDRDLTGQPLLEACETIGGLMAALRRPGLVQLDDLSGRAARWGELLATGHPAVPRRLTTQAAALVRDLSAGADPRAELVHEDLHFGNVLAAHREPWLAIDPQPVNGEWAAAVAPVVYNRAAEARAAHNLRTHLRLRADLVAGAAGLEEDRVRGWTFVRLVLEASWLADQPDGTTLGPDTLDLTGLLAAAKAFTD